MKTYSDFINEQKYYNNEFSNGEPIMIDEGLFSWLKRMWTKFTDWLKGNKNSKGRYTIKHWPYNTPWDNLNSTSTDKDNKPKNTETSDDSNDKSINSSVFKLSNIWEITNDKFEHIINDLQKMDGKNDVLPNYNYISLIPAKKTEYCSATYNEEPEFKYNIDDVVGRLIYVKDEGIYKPLGLVMYVNKLLQSKDGGIPFLHIVDFELTTNSDITGVDKNTAFKQIFDFFIKTIRNEQKFKAIEYITIKDIDEGEDHKTNYDKLGFIKPERKNRQFNMWGDKTDEDSLLLVKEL